MDNHKYLKFLTLIIITGLLAVSTASIFIRFAQREAPSLVIAALRLALSAIILFPIALKNHLREILTIKRKDLLLIILSGLFLSLHFASWISSLALTSIASSVVLVATGPIWVAIFSKLWLRENQNLSIYGGIFIALVGLLAIAINDSCIKPGNFGCLINFADIDQTALNGDILALAGALMVAGYFLLGRNVRQSISLIPYIFLVYSSAAIFLFILIAIFREPIIGYSSETYLWILLLALVPQTIGHSIYNWALKHISATIVSMFTLGEPIGTTILAIFIFNEYPTLIKIIGMILILGGIYFVSRISRNIVNS